MIFETRTGSRAYGLAREGSDEDFRGVVVGPASWYLGFRGGPEQIEHSADHVWTELRKVVRLAAQANPTLLEMLFTDEGDHTVVTDEGRVLLEARERFLSRRVEGSFAGYALSQLHRIRTHRRWLLSPPREEPTRSEFGLPAESAVSRDQLGAIEALEARGTLDAEGLSPNFLDVIAREKRYRAARREWDQHRQWQRERNPKRAALEAVHGYDTKHAMHLVRLLRMAIEILGEGRVIVKRPDRDELLAIRDGAFRYEELEARCEALRERLADVARSTTLPAAPDEDALDALTVELVARVHARTSR
ncbi:MAG: nucleotidyltransferase domain-containing protein [Sandaracinaceae bacterium]|nr:nucleotidyltransferase domain-containing protein [Sandaracinaceae bacterium]